MESSRLNAFLKLITFKIKSLTSRSSILRLKASSLCIVATVLQNLSYHTGLAYRNLAAFLVGLKARSEALLGVLHTACSMQGHA